MYSNALLLSSPVFVRPDGDPQEDYYYEAIQVTIVTASFYTFTSNSSMDTFGYFYDTSFNPSDPEANLIIEDDDSGFQLQFHIRAYLRPEHTYILVVTTHWESTTGRFSILASGPASINLVSNTEPTTLPTTIGKFLQRTLPSENSYNSAESCSQSLVFLFSFSDRRKLSFLLSITHSNCDCFRLF